MTILKSPLSVSANTALKVKTYMCDFVTLKIFHCEDDPVCLSSLAPPVGHCFLILLKVVLSVLHCHIHKEVCPLYSFLLLVLLST